MNTQAFGDIARFDAAATVRGQTRYAADVPLPGLLHAMLVPATITKGTVTAIDTAPALAVPGVIRVLTPQDTPAPPAPAAPPAGPSPPPPPPMLQNAIAFRGQPIALVVAETLEAAIEGAEAVRATYDAAPFAAVIDDPGATREDMTGGEVANFGNAEAAFAEAATTIDASYTTAANHHNPIELLSTTASWAGGRLTIHEGTQTSAFIKGALARLLQIDPAAIDIISPQAGGAFGQKGEVQRHTAIVAVAARLTGRPVKLVVPRHQIFHLTRFRPEVRHRIRLGADQSGRMIAAHYDCAHQNSRRGQYRSDGYHGMPSRLYGIPNYHGTAAEIRLDTNSPAHMRAPFEHPAAFAFESAVDELAYAMGQDPVALRLANDTRTDPVNGNRLSTRFLNECLTQGAERFGWSKRQAEPSSMKRPDGTLVGWGVAAGSYQAAMHPAVATLRINADGTARYASAGHEMGQGLRTAIAQALIAGLRIDPRRLTIQIGDTSAAPQHHTAGSWGTASAVPIAEAAAARMTAALDELLDGRSVAGNMHEQLARVRRPYLEVEVSMTAPGQGPDHMQRMRNGIIAVGGQRGVHPGFSSNSYVAHFIEVHIEPHTRRIRVPRAVSVADCGRVVSPRTAASQLRGGVVWGIGAALREASEADPRYGGWLNADIAEYHVPVNADIGDIDVAFIDQPDFELNQSGVKGLGEVAMVGVAAALANAVFHATGRRLRALPMRIEHLL